jgi:ribonuclease D
LKVLIADNATKCRDLISVIKKHAQEYCVLGFDTEYVNHYQGREPVALLQLCTHQGLCVLFPFRLLGGVPVELYDLLGERSILKVGVSPYNDAKLLWDDYKLKVNGHLDLRHLARRLPEYTRGRLQDLTETFLGILPDSDASYITMSDWNATVLSPEQIDYAAKDAYYSIEVFKVVYNKNFNDSDPSNEEILDNCGPYINRTFP